MQVCWEMNSIAEKTTDQMLKGVEAPEGASTCRESAYKPDSVPLRCCRRGGDHPSGAGVAARPRCGLPGTWLLAEARAGRATRSPCLALLRVGFA